MPSSQRSTARVKTLSTTTHNTTNHREKRKMKCYSSAQFLLFGWMVCGVYVRRTTARTLVNCVYYYRFDTFFGRCYFFSFTLFSLFLIFILFAFAIETKYMQILRGRGEWGGKSEQQAEEKRKLCECENRFNWWKWQNLIVLHNLSCFWAVSAVSIWVLHSPILQSDYSLLALLTE